MKEQERYLVFRVPTYEEQHRDRAIPHLWGWTVSKAVIRVFKRQRDQSKYSIVVMDNEKVAREFSENELSQDMMIDYVELGDTTTGEMIPFFTTKVELQEAEVKIQRLITEFSSFERLNEDPTPYVNIMMNLNQYYQDLLEFIGYCPREMKDLFPSDDEDSIEDSIYDAYSNSDYIRENELHNVPGSHTIEKLSNRVIYSLQSFVMVLKDDL